MSAVNDRAPEDEGEDFVLVDNNFLNFTTEDEEITILLYGDNHLTFAFVMKIVVLPLIVIGLVGLVSLIAAVIQSRIFGQHRVCIYLIGISVCSILQLLQFGYEWISLLLKRSPTSNLFCKVWHTIDPVSR